MPTKKKPQDKAATTPDRIVPEEPAAIQTESGGEPVTTESGGEPITGIQLSPEAERFRARAMEHVAAQEAEEAAAAAQVAPPAQLTGPWALPQIAEIQADWPTRRQSATLQVELTETEICEQAHVLTAALTGLEIIKSEAKSSADAYKARMEEQQSTVNRSKTLIDRGTEDRTVECVWVYETAGLDAEGRVIIDPERRTLVRLDTGGVVRDERIPEEDRQLMLFSDEPEAEVADDDPEAVQAYVDGLAEAAAADHSNSLLADDSDEFAQDAEEETATGEEVP